MEQERINGRIVVTLTDADRFRSSLHKEIEIVTLNDFRVSTDIVYQADIVYYIHQTADEIIKFILKDRSGRDSYVVERIQRNYFKRKPESPKDKLEEIIII